MKISYHASMNLMSILEYFVTTIIKTYKDINTENDDIIKNKDERRQSKLKSLLGAT